MTQEPPVPDPAGPPRPAPPESVTEPVTEQAAPSPEQAAAPEPTPEEPTPAEPTPAEPTPAGGQPDLPAQVGPPPPPPEVPAPRKSRLGLILTLSALGVLLLCGCGVAVVVLAGGNLLDSARGQIPQVGECLTDAASATDMAVVDCQSAEAAWRVLGSEGTMTRAQFGEITTDDSLCAAYQGTQRALWVTEAWRGVDDGTEGEVVCLEPLGG